MSRVDAFKKQSEEYFEAFFVVLQLPVESSYSHCTVSDSRYIGTSDLARRKDPGHATRVKIAEVRKEQERRESELLHTGHFIPLTVEVDVDLDA